MSDSDLSAVLQPVNRAKGLPNTHYVSDEMFATERTDVLFANWSGVGFGKNVPNPGDVMPVDFLGIPLLLAHNQDGELKVFQNTCRHRGMILVDEKTNISGAIRCPYHSWCYNLKGELKSTPHVGGPGFNTHDDIRRDELGLIEMRSHIWHDIIFVNVSGDAAEFEDYASDVIERWSEFDQPVFHGGADSSIKLDVNCNWKLAVENYSESYHLPWIHPGLNSYSRLEDHYNIEKYGQYCGQGTLVYSPILGQTGERFGEFKDLSSKWDAGAEYISFFPNVLLGIHKDHFFAIVLEPISKDQTVEHVELYYADEAMLGDDWAAMRQANTAMWHEVFAEDIFVVEGMQRGRHGVKFDGGKFSPVMDGPTHCFHHWVASQISDSMAERQAETAD